MMKASDLSKNNIVSIHGQPHTVVAINIHTPTARGGGSIYKVRFRNVTTGQKSDQTFRSDDTLEEVDFSKRDVQYLYKDGDSYTFMDLEDYSQFEMKEAEIEEVIPYLLEDMEGITALLSEGRVLGLVMPDQMVMEIIETDPSIKGASATARTKPATLSTGLIVQVPEYIAQGETIKIDTRTNSFMSRA